MKHSKKEIYTILEEKGYHYEAVDHPPVFTMEEMEREINRGLSDVAKNVFLRDAKKKHWYLVVMAKNKNLDMVKLRETLGSTRLSFAREDYLMERLGVSQGAVSPLAVLNDTENIVEVIIDEEITSKERIGIHPCDNTSTIWMRFEDLKTLIQEHGNSIQIIKL